MILRPQRHLFDIPDDVAYLNCGYMGPLPKATVRAGEAAMHGKARPWHINPRDFFAPVERVRALFARLIGADTDDIALIPSASYGLATAARNLPVAKGQDILILAEQFPSNVHIWRELAADTGARLVTLPRPAPGTNTGWTDVILDAITDRTAIAALPHCHWTDGGLIDLETVRTRLTAHGAALVLDLTQSAGAWPFDVAFVRPDFAAIASYKWLLGPYSTGFLYAAPNRQEGRPIELSWMNRAGAEDFARLVDPAEEYAHGARRYDMGEKSQFHVLPMLEASLIQILAWEVHNISETLSERTRTIATRAAALGLSALPEGSRAGHYLGLTFPHGVPDGLLERLRERNIFVSVRGQSMRVTPHLYNTDADVERLFAALGKVL